MTAREGLILVCLAAAAVITGCGVQPEPANVAEEAPVEPPAVVETDRPQLVSAQVIKMETEMSGQTEEEAAPEDEVEPQPEPRKSPIKIVPTRPMFQDDWQDEQYDEPYEDEYVEEEFNDEGYEEEEVDYGPQITDYHLEHLRIHQELYMVKKLMPVPGVLIDAYTKGFDDYEVWEWRSYSEEKGETVVRIRFINDEVFQIMINPGEYMLMR